jgi:hypothetical protein
MNPRLLTSLCILAMIAAFLVVAVDAKAAAVAFTVAGILAVLVADYGRDIKPLRARGRLVSFEGTGSGRAELDEAA